MGDYCRKIESCALIFQGLYCFEFSSNQPLRLHPISVFGADGSCVQPIDVAPPTREMGDYGARRRTLRLSQHP